MSAAVIVHSRTVRPFSSLTLADIPVGQHRVRIEAVAGMVDAADDVVAEVGLWPPCGVMAAMPGGRGRSLLRLRRSDQPRATPAAPGSARSARIPRRDRSNRIVGNASHFAGCLLIMKLQLICKY